MTIRIFGDKIPLFFTLLFLTFYNNLGFAASKEASQKQNVQSMRFAVPYFPPYVYLDDNNQLTGLGISRVKKVLDNMELNYEFELVANYGVALKQLRRAQVDGFFLATQNKYRDEVAKITDPVLMNNWSWFYKKYNTLELSATASQSTIRIGTLLNTNTQVWLQDNGYTIATLSHDVDTLISMLLGDRIDAVFLSESVFLYALQNHIEKHKIESRVALQRGFSLYVSHSYLAEHRWFMDAFNDELAKLKASDNRN